MLQRYTTGHHCTADCTLDRSGDEEMSALQIYIINRLPLHFCIYETMELPIEPWKMNFNQLEKLEAAKAA